LLLKVNNDGFDLGAQRRPIKLNDLPAASAALKAHKQGQKVKETPIARLISRQRILDADDLVLSFEYLCGERSRANGKWPLVELGELCSFIGDGDWVESKDQSSDGIRLIQTGNIGMGEYLDKEARARFITLSKFKELNCTEVHPGDVLVSRLPDPVGRACLAPDLKRRMIAAVDCSIIRFKPKEMIPEFFIFLSLSDEYYTTLAAYLTGASRQRISRSNLEQIRIPKPPIDRQREILTELLEKQSQILASRRQVEDLERNIRSRIGSVWS